MQIDIYAKWFGMTDAEEAAQITSFLMQESHAGFLREATKALVPEAYMYGRANISARVLLGRLPNALRAAEERERNIHGATNAVDIERVLNTYRDFVALCAQKEYETGRPVLIVADY